MEKLAFCKNCGRKLNDLQDSSFHDRVSCPSCGSVTRRFEVKVEGTFRFSSYLAGLGFRERKTTIGDYIRRVFAFRESARQGRVASADQHDDGLMSFSISGSSPQNEEDADTACQILINVLNTTGAKWANLVKGKEPADWEVFDMEVPNRKLSMQVIRALTEKNIWKQLNNQKSFKVVNISRGQLVDEMKNAIEKKLHKYDEVIRQNLVLVLDANRLPILGFDDIRTEFQQQLGDWIKLTGFEAIWLVGPNESLTWRLDC